MSFDLYFYAQKQDTKVSTKIKEFFIDKKNFHTQSLENGDYQFLYKNEDTGVYF